MNYLDILSNNEKSEDEIYRLMEQVKADKAKDLATIERLHLEIERLNKVIEDMKPSNKGDLF